MICQIQSSSTDIIFLHVFFWLADLKNQLVDQCEKEEVLFCY